MTYERHAKRIRARLTRIGQQVEILARSEGAENSLGNPTDSYSATGDTVTCVRSYPNRNTEITQASGDRNRDKPIFFFPRADAPDSEYRIKYTEPDGSSTIYEMQAPTRYETHTEMFGKIVNNP